MRGRGNRRLQLGQKRNAADEFGVAGVLQPLVEQRQVVGPPAFLVHRLQVAIDAAMGLVVKVVRAQDQRHLVAQVGQQQHAAQHGPLGLQAARAAAGLESRR